MSDDRDILGQADALLRRHAPARPGSEDVPMLTELITPGAATAPPREHDRITKEILAEVMAAVELRLAPGLERRLADHLVAEVHLAVAAALVDLRQDIANAVGDALAEALARRQVK
jgi:hypothetical protein